MSGWDAYISNLKQSSSNIEKAAIIGLTDASVWARSDGFKGTDSELKALVTGFQNVNDVPSKGADLEGVHYIVPRAEESIIFGKKDKSGFFAAKTKSAILIAVFKGESAEGSEVRAAIEKLAKYLEDTGY